MVQGAFSCSEAADPVRRGLIARRMQGEAALLQRLKRALSEGDLGAGANPADLAPYTVSHSRHGRASCERRNPGGTSTRDPDSNAILNRIE